MIFLFLILFHDVTFEGGVKAKFFFCSKKLGNSYFLIYKHKYNYNNILDP